MVENLHEVQDLFLSKTILAIVELQNEIAVSFFKNLSLLYSVFFVTPFVAYNTFEDLSDYGVYLLTSGLLV